MRSKDWETGSFLSVARKGWGKLRCAPRLLAAPEVPVPFAPELEAHYRVNGDKIMTSIMEMLGEE